MEQKPFAINNLSGESPIPAEIRLDPAWGQNFGREWGLAIKFPNGNSAAVFLDKRLSGSSYDEIMQVLGADSVAGHVITCENKEWVVKVEPTSANRYGITIYTANGKALMAGEGEVTAAGQWSAQVQTLYPGIRNSKRIHGQVGAKGGTGQKTEFQGGVIFEIP